MRRNPQSNPPIEAADARLASASASDRLSQKLFTNYISHTLSTAFHYYHISPLNNFQDPPSYVHGMDRVHE